EFEKFLRGAAPIPNVGFVPHFPIPGFHLRAAVPFEAMPCPLKDQFFPPGIILWRVCPAGKNLIISSGWTPMMLIRLRMCGQRFGHEPDFNIRPDAVLQVSIEDTVEDRPIVDGCAIVVLAVSAC